MTVQRRTGAAWEVLHRSHEGVLLVGPTGTIQFANKLFRKMFSLAVEPKGQRPLEVVPLFEIHEVVAAALRGEEQILTCVWGAYDLVLRARRLSGGEVVVFVEDVTHENEVARARTGFVANVSHELRTPISAIMGYTETMLLDRDRIPSDLVRLVETVERNAHRLRDVFEDLLRLHRIEVRGHALPLTRQPLRPVLEQACVAASEEATERGQSFSLRCPAGLMARINAEALQTIVANLANNAAAYTPSGGRIRVGAGNLGSRVVVTVTDDGIGIEQADHERIFERFYRVDAARSRRAGGTGLGLAIVKHLALASGCHVTVQSEFGKGSTFTVELPAG